MAKRNSSPWKLDFQTESESRFSRNKKWQSLRIIKGGEYSFEGYSPVLKNYHAVSGKVRDIETLIETLQSIKALAKSHHKKGAEKSS